LALHEPVISKPPLHALKSRAASVMACKPMGEGGGPANVTIVESLQRSNT
jgi:hypothetical protein